MTKINKKKVKNVIFRQKWLFTPKKQANINVFCVFFPVLSHKRVCKVLKNRRKTTLKTGFFAFLTFLGGRPPFLKNRPKKVIFDEKKVKNEKSEGKNRPCVFLHVKK
jgi:hypothetical protein